MLQLLFFFIIVSMLFPLDTLAHIRGIPIMKINGIDTKMYPAQMSTSLIFDLPSDTDIAPEPYLVNKRLQFVIDPKNLPIGEDVLKKTVLTWDFGDGSKPQKIIGGLKNSHTYKKIGTFTMQVVADYKKAGYEDLGEQPMQATVLSIIPYKSYQLPKATIKINNISTSEKKEFAIDLNNSLHLAASEIRSSAPVTSYQWDFGDGNSSTDQSMSHRYRLPQYYVTPLLRITDANGLFTDTFVKVRNSGKNEPNNPDKETLIWNMGKLGVIVLSIFVGFLIWNRRKSNN